MIVGKDVHWIPIDKIQQAWNDGEINRHELVSFLTKHLQSDVNSMAIPNDLKLKVIELRKAIDDPNIEVMLLGN